VLIPRFGAAGAATATSLAYVPYVVLSWWWVRRMFAAAGRAAAAARENEPDRSLE